jgi:hypothetical protein
MAELITSISKEVSSTVRDLLRHMADQFQEYFVPNDEVSEPGCKAVI